MEVNVLKAVLAQPKVLPLLLSCLDFEKDQVITCSATQQGLRFLFDDKNQQAYVDLAAESCREYEITTGSSDVASSGIVVEFRVMLQTLCDCLKIFGELSGLVQMGYRSDSKVLSIKLSDESSAVAINTEFKLATMDPAPATNRSDFRFSESPLLNRVILKSEDLKDALLELEWIGGTVVELTMSNEDPFFVLQTTGGCGAAQVEFPATSPDIFLSFDCQKEQSASFLLTMLQRMVRVLSVSSDVQVQMNEDGILNLQHSVRSADGHTCYVDFLTLPTFVDSDNED